MKTKNKDITLKAKIASFINAVILKKIGLVVCRFMSSIGRKRADYVYRASDYMRVSSLELVANEIHENNVAGSVAELGVFRGEFAKLINIAFPDRKLYLFDTFEGFDEKDVTIEHSPKSNVEDFSNTSIELVLNKMKYRENCIVKKGYFPQSSEGIEDTFAFVSIDADLYEPIYNGLCYFYPRLNRGGYIFIHDYNDGTTYTRVKEAVKKYCFEHNITYFPLSDHYGSAIIMK
ncbi:MAG: TylF/MycF family methyltransferase [Bacteroidales bacterium]|nr:TylF/MycF family methyltransferase [Bacteroidales bacterium]